MSLLLAILLLQNFAPFKIAAVTAANYSDTFSGASLDPKWTEYDPLNDVAVSVGSGLMTAVISAGTDHDLYTDTDHALRIRQNYSGSANFIIEGKFNTTMTAGYQVIGMLVETDNSNLAVFELVYDVNGTQYATAATFAAMAYTQKFWQAAGISAQPYYLRLEKSGTTYTCKTSNNGSSYTTESTFTWAGTVNKIGFMIGTASGASSPAHTQTVDSFTYTAQ